MKKSILAVAGLAAVAGVAMPLGGAFAENYNSYQDNIAITIESECSVLDSTGGYAGASPIESNFSETMALSTVHTFASTDSDNIQSFSIVCNDDGQNWHLDAAGIDGSSVLSDGTHSIPSITTAGTAPTAADSRWAFKMVAGTTSTISGTYNNWSAIPTSNTTVVTGAGAGTVGRSYIVSVDNEQEPGTYEGGVVYSLFEN